FSVPAEEKPRLQPTLQKSAGSVLGGMRAMARPAAPVKRAAPAAAIKATDTSVVRRILAFACEQLVPRLQRTDEEISNLLNG
ncbi:hypothetical protein ABTK16_20380, partial [Acinetobacter baumannii]